MTQALTLPTALEAEAEETRGTLATLGDWALASEADRDEAAGLLVAAVERRKVIEAERVKITGPLHQGWRAACEFFKRVDEPWARAESVLREKVGAFELAHKAKQVEAAQAIAAGDDSVALVAPLAPTVGVAVVERWVPVVVDASLVPREFLVVDTKALAAHCKGAGTPAPVPGVRFDRVANTRMAPVRGAK